MKKARMRRVYLDNSILVDIESGSSKYMTKNQTH